MDKNAVKVFGATVLLIGAVIGSAVISTEIHSPANDSASYSKPSTQTQ